MKPAGRRWNPYLVFFRLKSSSLHQCPMNEKMAGLGAAIFILGALLNLSAVGEAAVGNFLFASSYYGLGFAIEVVAFVILGVGLKMNGKAAQPHAGSNSRRHDYRSRES